MENQKEHNTGHNSRGGRVGPGGDCEASGEAPSKSTVGSFTKRSGVERRARATDEFSFLYNQQVNRWHYDMVTLTHFMENQKEHNTGHNSRGGRVGPGGDCEASGEALSKSTVGSFTKRSGVERRARATDEFPFYGKSKRT